MKITLILLTAFLICIHSPAQNTKDYGFSYKHQFNFSNNKGLTIQYGESFHSDRKKLQGNNLPASIKTIKQKLVSQATDYWDETSGQWITYSKNKFRYDENLNCILDLTSYWDPINNHWQDFLKTDYTFDAPGNLTSWVYSSWDDYNKQWRFSDKCEYEYDAEGRCILANSYRWNENINQWEIFPREEYTYNTEGNRTSMVRLSFHEDINQWVLADKEEYSYDTNENLILNNLSYWNDLSGSWVNNGKQEYFYDSAGNNILINDYRLNWADSTWIETIKEERTFDRNRNLTVLVKKEDWGDLTKIEFTYDNNYPFEELILPYLFTEEYSRHMWTMVLDYSHSETGWMQEARTTLFYTEVNTSNLSDLEDDNIYVFPNPSSQFVSFDADKPLTKATLVLIDMQGRQVMNRVVDNNSPVSIKQLDKGLYIYRLSDAGGDYTGKLVIE